MSTPLLKPETTADRINAIVNDPSVYPWVRGDLEGPIDLAPVVANPDNVVLVGEHGGIIFVKLQPGLYECHTSVLPEGRGPWVKENSAKTFAWMFLNTDAVEIVTRCPHSNPAALYAANKCGMTKCFTTRAIWPHDGVKVPMDVFSLSIEKWVNTADDLVEQGQKFHALLDAEYLKQGREPHTHEEDETHDRFVGATSFMINAGLPWKAINFYNRWAVLSAYEPIQVVSADPLIIDIVEARLQIEDNNFEVLECQPQQQ